jgi:protein-S-isoprenylcysteine O-methyltransferase Ste14
MRKLPSKDILFVGIQLFLFIIYFISPIDFTFPSSPILKIGSLLLLIIGFIVIVIAILQLNKNLTPFPTPKEEGMLIQTGLYKFVRHPIYSGIILTALGFGLFVNSYWKVFIGIALWILFYFKSRYEESLLEKHFKEYKKYRNHTRRFFPFV